MKFYVRYKFVQKRVANPLLFKIDVEGYEPFVLKGIKQTIDSFNNMLGYIEFNNEFIQNAGLDVNTYLSFLQERFYIYFIKDEEIIKYSSFENMKEYFCGSKIHTDLLLCKDSRIVEKEIINISQNI